MKKKIIFLFISIIHCLNAMENKDDLTDDCKYIEAIKRFEEYEKSHDRYERSPNRETVKNALRENFASIVERDKTSIEIADEKGTYGLINRSPQYDTLVIGCGNQNFSQENLFDFAVTEYELHMSHVHRELGYPLCPPNREEHRERVISYREHIGHDHKHSKCDTIDVFYTMNPTILYALGSRKDIFDIFKGKKYSVIILEGCEWYSSCYPKERKKLVDQNILDLLDPVNGLVIFPYTAIDNDHIVLCDYDKVGKEESSIPGYHDLSRPQQLRLSENLVKKHKKVFSIENDIRPQLSNPFRESYQVQTYDSFKKENNL